MMRNVAIGAVLGFAVVVLLLSVFNQEPPPPAGAFFPDAGTATQLQPVNLAPVVKVPMMARDNGARQQMLQRLQEVQQERNVELTPAAATDGGT
jgi:hypothetical protein